MADMLTGLCFTGELPPEVCSEYMRATLKTLVGEEHITFDRLLFPYADTLLLSDGETRAPLFGTHALLLGVDADTLARAVFDACGERTAELAPAARQVECTGDAVRQFLSEHFREEKSEYIGEFSSLLEAKPRPWSIREKSRELCSFCEQAARTEGVRLRGLMGGSVCADIDPDAVDTVIALYRAKTGGSAVRD